MRLRAVLPVAALVLGACASFSSSSDDAAVTPGSEGGAPDGGGGGDGPGVDEDAATPEKTIVAKANVKGLAAGLQGVAWLDDGDKLFTLPKGETNPNSIYLGDHPSGSMAVSGGSAYVAQKQNVASCRLTGCSTEGLETPIGQPKAGGLMAIGGGSELYFTDSDISAPYRLAHCMLGACKTPTAVIAVSSAPKWLVAAGANRFVYAITAGSGLDFYIGNTRVGAAPTVTGVALDAKYLYWTDDGAIHRVDDQGAGEAVLQQGLRGAREVTLDGDRLVWIETGSGLVRRCDAPDCKNITEIGSVPQPTHVAAGDGIFVSSGDGNLYRFSR